MSCFYLEKDHIKIDFVAGDIIVLHRISRHCSHLIDSSFDQIRISMSTLEPTTAYE